MTIGKKIKILLFSLLGLGLLITLYRYSPYKVEYLGYYNKIWAHRVNSTEKLNTALYFFDGVELDLVYNADKDVLDVTHPPVPSINLSLEVYLLKIETAKTPYLWLDIKNITSENERAILKRLMLLFSEKNYPFQKVLVESQRPETLSIFAKAGFKTSFYLPPTLKTKTGKNLEVEINKIKEILSTKPWLSISSSYEDYELMRTHFPNTKKYTWIINSVFTHGFSQPRKILRDTTVQAVLISYKPLSGHR